MKNYTKYKDSQLGWLGKIPEHWEVKKSKYLFDITKRISGELGHNILSITQKGIKIKDTESGGGQLSMDYSKYQIVDKGDFGMNHMDLLTGYVDISKYDGVMSPDYRVFKLKDKESDARFMLYLFQKGYWDKLFFPLGQGSSELGRWRLPSDEFKLFKFPVPSKTEQITIADFLDNQTTQIKKFIELKEKTIELLKERKTAIINQAVTKGLDPNVEMKDSGVDWLGEIPKHWEVKKLKYLSKYIKTGTTPSTKVKDYFSDGEIEWFTPGDFKNVFLKNSKRKLSLQALKDKEIKILEEYSIYLIGIGGTLGKVGVSAEKGSSNQQINISKFKDDVINYLFGLYQFQTIGKELIKWVNYTTMPIFNQSQQKELVFVYPDKSEQKKIVDFIEKNSYEIDESIFLAEKEITIIKEYQQSLISEVVTGKIDVREK